MGKVLDTSVDPKMTQKAIAYIGFAFLSVLAVMTGLGVSAAQAAGAALNDGGKGMWIPTQDPFVVFLRPALAAAGKAARISYAGCQLNKGDALRIPQVSMQPPRPGTAGLAAIREMFQNDKNIVATEDPEGIIRITIGDFSKSIEQTRISLLTLTPLEQYNGVMVIPAMETTSEVVGVLGQLGLRQQIGVIAYQLRQPALGGPHLPPSMSDVTVDQVLDAVAATFRAIVLYGVCAQSGEIAITYVDE